MKISNLSNLIHSVRFLRAYTKQFNTRNLITTLKVYPFPDQKHHSFGPNYGFCRYSNPYRIMAHVNSRIFYPYNLVMAIGSKQTGSGFTWIYDSEVLCFPDDAMTWVLGHELWHFLCHTKQRKGNWQTKANAFGFEMLRAYKTWCMTTKEIP